MEQTAKMMSDIVCPVVRSDVTCYWKDMWRRLDAMRRLWQLCDVRLCTDDGSTFMAHSPVLAASSDVLHRMLVASHAETFADGSGSIMIRNVTPDVLRVTLDFIYGVTPTSRADFERLRAGAAQLGIDGAYEYCCRRLDGPSKGNTILSPLLAADNDNQQSSDVQQRSAMVLKVEIASSASDKYSSCGSSAGSQTPHLNSDPVLPLLPANARTIPASTPLPPAEFHHAEMMSQMSLDDLTRVDECPHFRRIVGDMLEEIPTALGAVSQVGDDLDLDVNSDMSDTVPLKKRFAKQRLSDSTSCSIITSSPSRGINVSANNSIVTSSVPLSFESCFVSRSLTSGGGFSNITPFSPSQSGGDFQNVSKSFQIQPPQSAAADYDSWQNNGGDFIGSGLNSSNDLFLSSSSSTSCPRSMSSLLQNFEPPTFLPNSSLSPPSVDARPTMSSCLIAFESAPQESNYPFGSGLFSPDMSSIPSNFIPCSRVSPTSVAKLRSFSAVSVADSLPLISNSVVWNDRYFSTGAVPTNVAAVPLSHASERPNSSSFSMASTSAINLPKTSVADGPMAASTNQIIAAIPADVKRPVSLSAVPNTCPRVSATSLCREAGPPASMPFTEFDSGGFISLDDVSAVLKANGFAEKVPTPSSITADQSEVRADGVQKENVSVEGVTNRASVQPSTTSTSRLCSLCMKKCKTERQLINHIRSAHTNASDGSNSCASCAAVLPSVAELARHLESAHGRVVDNGLALALSRLNGNFCYHDGCTYQNPHADALQRHLHRRHGIGQPTLFCPSCNKSYFSVGQLNRHTSQAHSSRVVPPAVDTADDGSVSSSCSVATATTTTTTAALVHCDRSPGLSCPDCGEMLSSPYKLQIHQLRMHNKGKLFTCHHCSFKSPRKKDVQAHMLSQHGTAPPGVRVYSCTLCNYKCIDKNRFEEHEAMHTGIPRYRCTLCPRVYTTRRGLRTHIKYHSSDRPHSCATCGASFKVRSKLADHIKLVHIQKGLKPYECGYCGHATALRGNCNQHIRKSHPGMALAVVDRLAAQRRTTKDYDYAGITGAGIEEHRDLRAAGWTESRAGLAL